MAIVERSSSADRNLTTLVSAVDDAIDRSAGASPAQAIADSLRTWLDSDPTLPVAATTPDPSRYGQRVLHTDPRRGYSIAAFVWLPGQETPIHDHRSWCVTGVVSGAEIEERFELEAPVDEPGASGAGVTPTVRRTNPSGSVGVLEPPHDVHRVRNDSASVSISLHVYGIDLARVPSSIAHTYPDAPPADPDGPSGTGI